MVYHKINPTYSHSSKHFKNYNRNELIILNNHTNQGGREGERERERELVNLLQNFPLTHQANGSTLLFKGKKFLYVYSHFPLVSNI